MTKGVVTLDEFGQRYVDAGIAVERAKFEQAGIAWAAKESGGRAALVYLAQQAHCKTYTVQAQADTFDYVKLCEGRPTLTWLHLKILAESVAALAARETSDKYERPAIEPRIAEEWADKTADNDWSPADLRKAIAKAVGVNPDDPSVIIRKAESNTEKLRKVVDEAVEAKVVDQVMERVESAYQYAQRKAKAANG